MCRPILRALNYTPADCADETEAFVTGTEKFTQYNKQLREKLTSWLNKRDSSKKKSPASDAIEYVDKNSEGHFVSLKLNVLAEELNTHCRKQNCIHGLMNNTNTNFQQWYLLSVDVPERMPWFDRN